MKKIGSNDWVVYAYIFLGKKRILKKIYQDINRGRETVKEGFFISEKEVVFIKECSRFFVRLYHMNIVKHASFRIK
ncbi:hypothetical protein HQ51_0212740 [Bacillus altitudinis]|nr:hypothetical protein HQ51_0212740 [Bacillus altitudinis]MDR4199503.1 hypothetical protein [Bacillus altitudinis]